MSNSHGRDPTKLLDQWSMGAKKPSANINDKSALRPALWLIVWTIKKARARGNSHHCATGAKPPDAMAPSTSTQSARITCSL